jgi:hypothetical protein
VDQSKPMLDQIKAIDTQIRTLEAARQRLIAQNQQPWPRRVVAYLHGSKEAMWDLGQELGLSEAACEQFVYACYEVGIVLNVNEDGTSQVLGIEGVTDAL